MKIRNMMAVGGLLGLVWAGWPAAADARARAGAHAHSGGVQKGKASIYATRLQGRRMADGTAFDPASNAAASKTLPLGTVARVTNLKNGRTAMVQVRDRGPHVAGRIIDVSPGSAGALGIKREGVAPVAVTPLGPLRESQAR